MLLKRTPLFMNFSCLPKNNIMAPYALPLVLHTVGLGLAIISRFCDCCCFSECLELKARVVFLNKLKA